jgi:hypothetical protein
VSRADALGALLLVAVGSWAGVAQAHSRGTSYSEWALAPDGAQVRARVPQLELTRLALDPAHTPEYAARVAALLAAQLTLVSDAGPCEPRPGVARIAADGWVVAHWTVRCPGAHGRAIRCTLLHAVAPSHLHFARVRGEGPLPQERVLTFAQPRFALDEGVDAAASFGRYVRLGIDHILSGWDHLAFVLALILLARRLGEVALLATGFTAAHSLTLVAAALGWARVHAGAVEAVIGFSIALVAAENLWLRAGRERWLPWLAAGALAGLAALGATRLPPVLLAGLALFTACHFALAREAAQPLKLRIALAFVFGLAHGFGFAGALDELRLPPEGLALGLLGFNAGVEAGQLLVIAATWPVLKLLERRAPLRLWAGDLASAGVCALGMYWFVERSLG